MSTIRIGIDIGALFIKVVRLDESSRLTHQFYQAHKGDPGRTLEQALVAVAPNTKEMAIGITGRTADLFADTLGVALLDLTSCQIAGVRSQLPEATNIIDIGGASASLIRLDSQGRFVGLTTNSLCAAGTGSFLDEQAVRLGVDYAEMEQLENIEAPPTIATRCAVFAKSDLIHRQQEGYSKDAMWSGLCRGMTRTLLQTLLNGRPLDGPAALIGGVAQNQEVIRWLEAVYPQQIFLPDRPHLMAAIGAAYQATEQRPVGRTVIAREDHASEPSRYDWPLTMERSVYPSFDTQDSFVDDQANEVRLVNWPEKGQVEGVLGIDIGSTSTKAALVDTEDRVILDIYRKTAGDPIGATKHLLRALRELAHSKGQPLVIRGVGTTGSGRKLVGKVIGADAIINEISAHVAGAVATDPSIDTIFEIGGQDSKYMHVVDGHIRDANMNYVCAAGTGSFVEEQANKLGYAVADVGPAVLGQLSPMTSDRCTVFMEQDVSALVQSGTSAEQALAGVMVSVVKNYLNKVVGNRYRSRQKIFFQGATARNPALVAAFERLLNVTMVVSPYCHVMGAYGVALLTRGLMLERSLEVSAFRGLDLDQRQIEIRYETCDLCQNDCKIAFAKVEGIEEEPSWGYLCGRDPAEQRVRINRHEKPLRLRQKLWKQTGGGIKLAADAPVVGLPQALTTYTYLPLWRRFLNRLGYRVVLSGTTDETIRELGTRMSGAEFCFPAKLVLGHVAKLATQEGVDFILIPHMVSERRNQHTTGSKFCPYVQSAPSFTKSALSLNGIEVSQVLSPVIDMRREDSLIVDRLCEELAIPLCRGREQIRQAFAEGMIAQRSFERSCRKHGQRVLKEARKKGEKLLVLLGRPYNNYDTGQNLGLPQKLAELGRTVLPLDFLTLDLSRLGKRYHNIFWSYGQKILAACEEVAADDQLDAVYLTNFNCGPDSFLLSFAEEIMGNRPFLALELDEHGADAGYMTRIEAFFDVLNRPRTPPNPRMPFRNQSRSLKDRIMWMVPMERLGTLFFTAAFRWSGYDARALPPEDKETFEIGRSVTRGAECLPTALTIGALLKAIRESGEPGYRHAFFLPTAEGPCRFGLYATLHRQVLDREGLSQVAILSPSSFNSYQGVDESLRRLLWRGMIVADLLTKAACRVRPYEINPGETNAVFDEHARKIAAVIESGGDLGTPTRQAIDDFAAIPRHNLTKPLVGIVGEIYVRCNRFANEEVIDAIERFGGEAWFSPMSEWILYTAATQRIAYRGRNPFVKWVSDIKNRYLIHQEQKLFRAAGPFLECRREPDIEDVLAQGQRFLPIEFEGEAILTMGRAVKFAEQGASMVVNCAPFGCMPGTLTTALFRKLSAQLKLPIVSMFYDGNGNLNQQLQTFLNNALELPQTSKQPVPPWQSPLRRDEAR